MQVCNSYSRCRRLPKSCNELSLALACWGHGSGEIKLKVLRNICWTVLSTPCTGECMSCVAERQIILLLRTCLITVNICWDSKIAYQLSFDFSLEARQGTTPTFDTATDITTDMVKDKCVVADSNMLYFHSWVFLVHMAYSCENEVQFSCDQVIIWMHFLCLY